MSMVGTAGWLVPVAGLVGAVLGGVLSPWVGARFARHTAKRQAFDKAIAAVRTVQVARHYASNVPAGLLGGLDQGSADEFNIELRKTGVQRFIEATYEAKVALAALEPYGNLFRDGDGWEITESEADALLARLKRAR
ncbi:hypothetical protein GCM10009639_20030 [Kitasatospora putterlickiae]|uniref:Uncharacterized protein n=1 Tax=Kitasatospora putterlickiae TaxID=221725 RepID=A0ABP4IM30_9ACTN